ncbi:MAG: Hsp20/alpha crystallin family protein [Chlamydiota bacterium]
MKKSQIKKANTKPLSKSLSGKTSEWLEPRSLFKSFSPIALNGAMEKLLEPFHEHSGVSVSEDEKNVYVEAALPGITPEEIEMNYDRGMLSIKADKKEETEDKKKKFYRKAHKSFFYQVAVPGTFDETKTPEAICKNGILKVVFAKNKNLSTKKPILIKKG